MAAAAAGRRQPVPMPAAALQHNSAPHQQLEVKELSRELCPSPCTSPSGIPFPRQAENFHAPSARGNEERREQNFPPELSLTKSVL